MGGSTTSVLVPGDERVLGELCYVVVGGEEVEVKRLSGVPLVQHVHLSHLQFIQLKVEHVEIFPDESKVLKSVSTSCNFLLLEMLPDAMLFDTLWDDNESFLHQVANQHLSRTLVVLFG